MKILLSSESIAISQPKQMMLDDIGYIESNALSF